MKLTWDETKRQKTLQERQLDFNDAAEVFAQCHLSIPDERIDYGEPRFIIVGFLQERMTILVFTPRVGKQSILFQ